jgi:hypothetical protein
MAQFLPNWRTYLVDFGTLTVAVNHESKRLQNRETEGATFSGFWTRPN